MKRVSQGLCESTWRICCRTIFEQRFQSDENGGLGTAISSLWASVGPVWPPHAPPNRFLELSGSHVGGHFVPKIREHGGCFEMLFWVVLLMGFWMVLGLFWMTS